MGVCNFQAPNGEKSLLHAGLSQLLGEPQATLAWYKLQSKSTDNIEPSLQNGLQQLNLGTPDQVDTMQKFAKRWHLTPVSGRLMTYQGTRSLARVISKQLAKSEEVYDGIRIRYDATHGFIELLPAQQSSIAAHFEEQSSGLSKQELDLYHKLTDSKTIEAKELWKAPYKEYQNFLWYWFIKKAELSAPNKVNLIKNAKDYHAAYLIGSKIPNTDASDNIFNELIKVRALDRLNELRNTESSLPAPLPVNDFTKPADGAKIKSREDVIASLNKLVQLAKDNPDKQYAPPFTGDSPTRKMYNGYTAIDIAQLFAEVKDMPANIILNESFKGLMTNLPMQFLANEVKLEDQSSRPVAQIDEATLQQAMKQILTEIKDADGKGTGKFFSSDQMIEAADSVLYEIQLIVRKEGKVGIPKAKKAIFERYQRIQRSMFLPLSQGTRITNTDEAKTDRFPAITTELAKSYFDNMENVLNTFDDLFKLTLQRLSLYSINVEDSEDTSNKSLADQIDESSGKGLVDFDDEVFALDPKDTASGRLKLFMATLEDVEFGEMTTPKIIKLPLKEDARLRIAEGKKTSTFRTTEQANRDVKLTPGIVGRDSGIVNINGTEYLATATKIMSQTDADSFNTNDNEKEDVAASAGDIFIELRPYIPGQKGFNLKNSFIGQPKLANLEAVMERAFGLLSGRSPNFDEYIKVLNDSNDVSMNWLARKLQMASTGQEIKNEFTSVMTKAYQEFTILIYGQSKDKYGNPYMALNTTNANRYSINKTIIETWKEQQKLSPIVNKVSGNYVMNRDLVTDLVTRLQEVQQLYSALSKMKSTLPGYKDMLNKVTPLAQQLVKDMLTLNGIVLSDEAYAKLFYTTEKLTEKTDYRGDFARQFSATEAGAPTGIFSIFINRLKNSMDEESEEGVMFAQNNPLYKETNTMEILAKLYAQYAPILYSSTHRNSEGKTVWDYSLNTYLSHTMRELTEENSAYRDMLLRTDYAKHNWLLNAMQQNAPARKYFTLSYLDGIKNRYGKKDGGITRAKMSPREQLLLSLGIFQNGGKKSVNFLSLTHSDKSKTPVFGGIRRQNITTRGKLTEQAVKQLYGLFQGEYDRIIRLSKAEPGIYKHRQYEKGGKFFYLLPQFNYDEMLKLTKQGIITPEEMGLVWIEKGTINDMDSNSKSFKALISKMLNNFANDLTTAMEQRFKEEGIVTDTTHMFDRDYMKMLHGRAGVTTRINDDTKALEYIDSTDYNKQITAQNYIARISRTAAMDYAVSAFLFNTAINQLITGDTAEYYKAPKGSQEDIAHAESTLTDYQKRLAGIIAPGKDGSVPRSETYAAVTLADYEKAIEYMKAVKAYAGGVNITDAQEFTTMREHLYMMSYYGIIKDDTYKEMINIIDKAGPGGYYEFTEPKHKAIILQIMKPVYFGRRNEANGAMLHDYIKSSSYPLYPALTKNLEIDKIRVAMENQNIARANFISAKKIGASGAVQIFNESGTIKDGVFDTTEWRDATQILNRGGLRLQQDTPYDEDKDQILTVSQMDVLITQGIANIQDFKLSDGTSLSGMQIAERKRVIRNQLIDINLEKFNDKTGAQITDGKLQITDKGKFLDRLAKAAKARGYNDNDIAAITARATDGMPVVPLFLSSASATYESLMMSLVNDIVKVKVDGKSFIQASSAGIKTITTDLTAGIKWVPGHDGKELKMMRKEDGKVYAAQVVVPFNFFTKSGKASVLDYMKDGMLDLERVPPELLQMIGARIPCQGHNSMIALEVVGFLPDNIGDTIIVPEGITTQMGSDFDVDKLYVYRRPHKHTDNKFISVLNAIDAEGNSTVKPDESLKAQYFDIHWSILTHPDMFDEVTKPLDNDDMKDEAALASKPSSLPFFDIGRQLDDFASQKDAKSMVGFYALNTKFGAMAEGKNIYLGEYVEDDKGNSTIEERPITIFKDEVTGEDIALVSLSEPASGKIIGKDGTVHTRTKQDNIRTQLSEVVDHAKNRTIDKLNLTIHTQPVAAAITLLGTREKTADGTAATLKHMARFMQQEGAIMYSQRMSKSSDSLSERAGDVKNDVMLAIRRELFDKAGGIDGDGTIKMTFSPKDLLELINSKNKDRAYWNKQLILFDAFVQFEKVGKRISEMQAVLSQGVNGAGPNMITVIDKLFKLADVLTNAPIINGMNLHTHDDALTEQGKTYEATITTASQVYNDLLPYMKLRGMMTAINTIQGKHSMVDMSNDTQKSIANSVKSFIFSGTQSNISGERARLLYHTEQGPSLAERIINAQNTEWGKKNYFLMRLRPTIETSSPSYVSYIAAKVTSMDDLENIRGWINMLGSSDRDIRLLGEDLLKYSYLTGGLQDANAFAKYIPFGYLVATKIPDYLRSSFDGIADIAPNFIRQWFQHNPNQAKAFSEGFIETGTAIKGVPEMFTLPINLAEDKDTNPAARFLVRENGVEFYTPFIAYRDKLANRWILYEKQDSGSDTKGPTYIRIDTLGSTFTDEYDIKAAKTRSLIPVNRAIISTPSVQAAINEPVESPKAIIQLPTKPIINSDGSYKVHPKWKAIGITQQFTSSAEVKTQVLEHIVNNQAAPLAYRELAKQMQKARMPEVMATFTKSLQSVTLPVFKVSDSPILDPILELHDDVENNMFKGKKTGAHSLFPNMIIRLPNDPSTLIDGSGTEIFLHEMMHVYTQIFTQLIYPSFKGPKVDAARQVASKALGKDGVKLKQVLDRIEDLRYKAASGYEGNSEIIKYALSSVDEFIAHTGTNIEFTQFLNSIQHEGQGTIFDRVIESIKRLFDAVAELIGMPVNENSLLSQALTNITQLTNYYNQGIFTSTEQEIRPKEIAKQVQGDSKYELFPGVFANENQKKAIDLIPNFITSTLGKGGPLASRSFVLSGAGGTGKTTVIKKILEALVTINPELSVAMAAPSHNAVVELKAAMGDTKFSINTLQSELRMIKNVEKSFKLNRDVFERGVPNMFPKPFETADVVVIDESSMVSDEMITWLEEAIKKGTVVIFMGDYAQLQPVEQDHDSFPFSEVMHRPGQGVVLTENMRARFADVSGIVTSFRKGLDQLRADPALNIQLPVMPFKDRINSENVTYLNKPSDIITDFVKAFKKAPSNPKNALVVAFRNATRLNYNTAIRQALWGEAAKLRYAPGELLIMNNGFPFQEDDVARMKKYNLSEMFNMQRVIVNNASQIEANVAVYAQRANISMTLKGPGYSMSLNMGPDFGNETVNIEALTVEYVRSIIRRMQGTGYNQSRRGFIITDPEIISMLGGRDFLSYGAFLELREEMSKVAFDAEYGYAVTSHKSQGSTYNHTFVDEQDISSVTMNTTKNKLSSLYTAVSRTKEKLFIYSPYNPVQAQRSNAAEYMSAASEAMMNGSNGPWTIDSDPQALIHDMSNYFPDITVDALATDIPGQHSISFGFTPVTKVTSPKIIETIKKLAEQRDDIRGSFTGDISKEEAADKSQRLQEIEKSIQELTDKEDLAMIPKIGEQQLKWVQSTLDKDSPSPNELMTSWRVVELWSNIIDLLYSPDATGLVGTAPDSLKKVASDAKNMRIALNAEKMRKALNDLSQEKNLVGQKFEADLTDIDVFSAYALSVNRATSALTQEVALLMQNTARNRDQEGQALIVRLSRLQDMMRKAAGNSKALPAFYDQFIQQNEAGNAWGIVGRYSQDWYDFRKSSREKRDASIKKIRGTPATIPGAMSDSKRIRKTWDKYWKDIDDNAIIIDTTRFFDEDGELKAGHESLLDDLKKQVGDAHAMNQLQLAQKRYKQFLEDKDAFYNDIEAKIAMGEYTPEDALTAKNKWFEEHSPDLFFKNKSGTSFTPNNRGDWYTVMVPKRSVGKYYDAKFENIMNDKAKLEIYNELKSVLETHRKMLPQWVQRDLGANFLPVVQRHLTTDITNFKDWISTLEDKAIDALTATEYETANVNDPKRIPIRFVNKAKFMKDGKIDSQALSHDLPRILELFGLMSIHYKHFSRAKDAIDMGHTVIKYIDLQRRAGNSPGETLGNTLSALEYTRDHLMYKRPKAVEGNTKTKLYSLNPVTQAKISGQVKELLSQRNKIDSEYRIGNITTAEHIKQTGEIDVKLAAFDGQNIHFSKVGDVLIKINQIKALAFNPFSGFANWAFGMVSLSTYAAGGQDFTHKEAFQAMSIMRSSMKKWWTFGAFKGETSEKILNVINRIGIENDVTDSEYGNGNLPGRKPKISKFISPFELLKSTDYYMKATITTAMLLHSKITVQKDGADVQMSMWDAIGNDGKFMYPVAKEWQADNDADATEWVKYRNKATRVNQIIMGNMDKNSPKLLSKKILGRLVGQFRLSWLPEGFAARFESEKQDIQLGRTIKGRYRTYTDLGWVESIKIQLKQLVGLVLKTDPFTGVEKLNGEALTDVDVENMKRNFVGLAWTLSTMAAIMALKHLFLPDDDDEDSSVKETMMIALNLMNRLNQDLTFYSSPDVANTVTRNVIPALDVINDYTKAVGAFNKALFTDDYGWDKAALKFTHATPYLNLINKFNYMTSRDLSTLSR